MAAKKIITVLALVLALSIHSFSQEQPKRSKLRSFTHWVATHKKVVVISAGTAVASGFTAWKLTHPNSPPIINDGQAVPCPSSACITVK